MLTQPLMLKRFFVYTACFFVLTVNLMSEVAAMATDREQPVNIEADWAEWSRTDEGRIGVYRGNAVVSQGSLNIKGDEITMFF